MVKRQISYVAEYPRTNFRKQKILKQLIKIFDFGLKLSECKMNIN